ncbi:uncharacterized protein LOC129585371 [Paramacrobiotus metropolitanus]|uniref:uncharacterized protein LOC129585371 n=1 Tax=Paramacrobiotus metropolitanus TaxID=2943436 RepID=UPI002445BD45|nr:uncharacterized protein LOC129585371 [Paramacrobiotus metropolitanus]
MDTAADVERQANDVSSPSGKGTFLRRTCIAVTVYTCFVGAWMLSDNMHDLLHHMLLVTSATASPLLFPPEVYLTESRAWSFMYVSLLLTGAIVLGCGIKKRSTGLHIVWIVLFAPYLIGQLRLFVITVMKFVDHSDMFPMLHSLHSVESGDFQNEMTQTVFWSQVKLILELGLLVPLNLSFVVVVFSHSQRLGTLIASNNNGSTYIEMVDETEPAEAGSES